MTIVAGFWKRKGRRLRELAAVLTALAVLAAGAFFLLWRNRPVGPFTRGAVVLAAAVPIPEDQEAALTLLNQYFSLRCGSFGRAQGHEAEAADGALPLAPAVRRNEADRIRALRRLGRDWRCRFSGAAADLRVEGWREDNGDVVCLAYEFVWFDNWYPGFTDPDSADRSGYGVRHALRLRRRDDGWILLADDYDEGRPTFAATPDRLNNADYLSYAGSPSDPESTVRSPSPALLYPEPTYFEDFNPDGVIAYADRWAEGRNRLEYPDLEPIGGDCCNFASQCLYEGGGLPLTAVWTPFGDGHGSPAWISSTKLFAALTGASGQPAVGRGVAAFQTADRAGRRLRLSGKTVDASAVLLPGSPVFYRWNGGFSLDGRWNHTAVCVGTMGDGAPAVSCHTADKVRIKWNYGGRTCDYGTVQMTPAADPFAG